MDPIILIEFFDTTHAFDEEGDEGGFSFFGDFGEDSFESSREIRAHVFGHLHSGDEDLDFWVFGSGFFNDAEEVLFGLFGRDPAEAVVATESNNEDVGSFCHGPVDAPKASGGGVTTNSGIGNGEGEFGFFDFFLKNGGVGLFWRKSVASSDAISQDDDASCRSICFRRFFGE